jgi:hypothetical protein
MDRERAASRGEPARVGGGARERRGGGDGRGRTRTGEGGGAARARGGQAGKDQRVHYAPGSH